MPSKIKWYKSARGPRCKQGLNPTHQAWASKISGNSNCTPYPSYTSHKAYKPPTNVVPPLPKPRVGQGRAGIRRKPKITPPIPKPIQTPAPPTPTPVPRAVQPLSGPVVQLQERTLPQHHVPAASPPLIHPTPASTTQPVKPRVEHRPIPPYHEPFLRPPPRPQVWKTIGKICWIWTWTGI